MVTEHSTAAAVDVLVVGAGAVGLSIAYRLASRGARVRVLDTGGVGAGASRTNAGWVVPSMSEPVPSPASLQLAARHLLRPDSPVKIGVSASPRYIGFLARMLVASRPSTFDRGLRATSALARRAFASFDRLEEDGVAFERHASGVLMLFRDAEGIAPHMRELGVLTKLGAAPAQVLSAEDTRQIEPDVAGTVRGSILCPEDQHVDPGSLVDGLSVRCRELGVDFSFGASVTDIRIVRSTVEVTAGHQVHRARDVVIAAGVGSRALAGRLGIAVPVRAGKGYGVDIAPPPVGLRHAVYLTESKVAVTPLDRGIRLAGTMEFGAEHLRVDERRVAGIHRAAAQYFQTWPQRASHSWAGLRPMTPDGLPLIGRLPMRERGGANAFIATGHAMLGVTLGPVTGELLSALILDGQCSPELEPFAPGRFWSVRRHQS